jgi:peptidylprolyl isomerase/FKBP-type peptidyl-prolyl cis-trans isomerase FklB
MKKYWSLITIALFAFTIVSCGDDDEIVVDEAWVAANEHAIDSVAKLPEYTKLEAGSKNGFIYYKVLRAGDPKGKKVLYTDNVIMKYCGALYDGRVFDRTEGTNMDGTFGPGLSPVNPTKPNKIFNVSELIEGWQVALQEMRIGDRWEVWIPWELGYGARGSSTIPGFSSLNFVMEVVTVKSEGI